jgi:hypothetical protein
MRLNRIAKIKRRGGEGRRDAERKQDIRMVRIKGAAFCLFMTIKLGLNGLIPFCFLS